MYVENMTWVKSKMNRAIGSLRIEDDRIIFIKKDMDHTKNGRRVMTKQQYSSEVFNKFLKSIFKSAKKAITKSDGGFNYLLSELKNIDISSVEGKGSLGDGSKFYNVNIEFDVNAEHYKLEIISKDKEFHKEVEAELM